MNAEAERLLGEADRLITAGRPAVAGVLLDSIAAEPSDIARLAIARARVALACNAPLTAVAAVDAAMTNGAPPDLLLWRSRAWLAAGDAVSALADSARAADAAPDHAGCVGLYATLLMEQGAFAAAAVRLNRAIEAGARDVALHVALAVALLSLDRAGAARAAVDRGLLAAPGNPALLRLQANADADALATSA